MTGGLLGSVAQYPLLFVLFVVGIVFLSLSIVAVVVNGIAVAVVAIVVDVVVNIVVAC